ncbi:response regulator [Myxococcus llanfairpwllgwyngyllgogerychwyrndrobwllllantysiliogogogochensis]|uniref:Response regulator n=1 Tax=Myxococcus llanfairpwllgwyngyllgogerychwyrndrobwllllantysiliogogogochensis TaxID=2590453 RepID=A0A540WU33_9BACT|nr:MULTISPECIES: response regulator [unclassified Myxococcus]TQF12521.1 response regulator [Myxococcus llanfairpwllgwyngyllgogerychwyrndrobwllllantysiliogogogochensis]
MLRSAARAGAAFRPVNILVVDDDLELCTLLSRFLEMHGYTVYSASDALQALDILERNQVGMVITDFIMPHMDGITFTEQLKADPRFQAIPVLLMTASTDGNITERGLRKGVALTLNKPLDMGQLLTLMRFAE